MFKQKIKTRVKASCKCEIILEHLEETAAIAGGVEEVVDGVEEVGDGAAIAGGIEEVVDGVEEEDEEAQDRQHGVWVHRVPG